MSTEKSTDLSAERKKILKKDLKEGLEGLKKIFVSSITLLIKFGEYIPKGKLALIKYREAKAQEKLNSSLSIIESQKNNSESVDVAVEIENKSPKIFNNLANNFIYPVLAIVSATTLVTGVVKMGPLFRWAKTQNECVENTVFPDKLNSNNLAKRVMSCNGGHEY